MGSVRNTTDNYASTLLSGEKGRGLSVNMPSKTILVICVVVIRVPKNDFMASFQDEASCRPSTHSKTTPQDQNSVYSLPLYL